MPIVDTSPLIVLSRAHLLDLLTIAGERVLVPTAVIAEVAAYGPDDPTFQAVSATPWLVTVESPPVPEMVGHYDLGPGESTVLAWALAHPGTVSIIDDDPARRVAKRLHLPVIGSLGLVLRAKRQGTIPAARPVLAELREAGMYLSDHILNEALALVGE